MWEGIDSSDKAFLIFAMIVVAGIVLGSGVVAFFHTVESIWGKDEETIDEDGEEKTIRRRGQPPQKTEL
jgi:hypothetical protein